MTCDFTVTEPLFAMAYAKYTVSPKGKYKWAKMINKLKKDVKVGEIVSLMDPNQDNVGLFYSKKSDDIKNRTCFYPANSTFIYDVSLNKKDIEKGKVTLTQSLKGRKQSVSFNAAGKYKIGFKTTEGSNQTFTYVVTVK